MNLTKESAELLGMHIGDGTLYKTNSNSVVWELRGGLNEKEFYDVYISELLSAIFEEKFKPKFRSGGKNGCYGIQTCNKKLINFFSKAGFLPGSKTYSVSVPDYIFSSPNEIIFSFIRGLFDTDGCFRLDRNHTGRPIYPKIEFGFASLALRDSLVCLLKKVGFNSHIWTSKGKYVSYKLCVAGPNKAKLWFDLIGSSNPNKIQKFKKWLELRKTQAVVAQPGTAQT